MRAVNLSQASRKLLVPLHLESMFNPRLTERGPELSTRAKLVSAYRDWACNPSTQREGLRQFLRLTEFSALKQKKVVNVVHQQVSITFVTFILGVCLLF